ncbi:serine/threonine-protein kinase atm [Anaeramoeba flamelloides]|uniref:Serine/threonine-protein kinase atm n=1 Tax=Anaeramoeba flamelloides TaxID=1746091 RepID=A0AAV7Z6R6_9EUKA|nr:serine/threonine-protein kinase atm [Anaeramoeba flamelloides]
MNTPKDHETTILTYLLKFQSTRKKERSNGIKFLQQYLENNRLSHFELDKASLQNMSQGLTLEELKTIHNLNNSDLSENKPMLTWGYLILSICSLIERETITDRTSKQYIIQLSNLFRFLINETELNGNYLNNYCILIYQHILRIFNTPIKLEYFGKDYCLVLMNLLQNQFYSNLIQKKTYLNLLSKLMEIVHEENKNTNQKSKSTKTKTQAKDPNFLIYLKTLRILIYNNPQDFEFEVIEKIWLFYFNLLKECQNLNELNFLEILISINRLLLDHGAILYFQFQKKISFLLNLISNFWLNKFQNEQISEQILIFFRLFLILIPKHSNILINSSQLLLNFINQRIKRELIIGQDYLKKPTFKFNSRIISFLSFAAKIYILLNKIQMSQSNVSNTNTNNDFLIKEEKQSKQANQLKQAYQSKQTNQIKEEYVNEYDYNGIEQLDNEINLNFILNNILVSNDINNSANLIQLLIFIFKKLKNLKILGSTQNIKINFLKNVSKLIEKDYLIFGWALKLLKILCKFKELKNSTIWIKIWKSILSRLESTGTENSKEKYIPDLVFQLLNCLLKNKIITSTKTTMIYEDIYKLSLFRKFNLTDEICKFLSQLLLSIEFNYKQQSQIRINFLNFLLKFNYQFNINMNPRIHSQTLFLICKSGEFIIDKKNNNANKKQNTNVNTNTKANQNKDGNDFEKKLHELKTSINFNLKKKKEKNETSNKKKIIDNFLEKNLELKLLNHYSQKIKSIYLEINNYYKNEDQYLFLGYLGKMQSIFLELIFFKISEEKFNNEKAIYKKHFDLINSIIKLFVNYLNEVSVEYYTIDWDLRLKLLIDINLIFKSISKIHGNELTDNFMNQISTVIIDYFENFIKNTAHFNNDEINFDEIEAEEKFNKKRTKLNCNLISIKILLKFLNEKNNNEVNNKIINICWNLYYNIPNYFNENLVWCVKILEKLFRFQKKKVLNEFKILIFSSKIKNNNEKYYIIFNSILKIFNQCKKNNQLVENIDKILFEILNEIDQLIINLQFNKKCKLLLIKIFKKIIKYTNQKSKILSCELYANFLVDCNYFVRFKSSQQIKILFDIFENSNLLYKKILEKVSSSLNQNIEGNFGGLTIIYLLSIILSINLNYKNEIILELIKWMAKYPESSQIIIKMIDQNVKIYKFHTRKKFLKNSLNYILTNLFTKLPINYLKLFNYKLFDCNSINDFLIDYSNYSIPKLCLLRNKEIIEYLLDNELIAKKKLKFLFQKSFAYIFASCFPLYYMPMTKNIGLNIIEEYIPSYLSKKLNFDELVKRNIDKIIFLLITKFVSFEKNLQIPVYSEKVIQSTIQHLTKMKVSKKQYKNTIISYLLFNEGRFAKEVLLKIRKNLLMEIDIHEKIKNFHSFDFFVKLLSKFIFKPTFFREILYTVLQLIKTNNPQLIKLSLNLLYDLIHLAYKKENFDILNYFGNYIYVIVSTLIIIYQNININNEKNINNNNNNNNNSTNNDDNENENNNLIIKILNLIILKSPKQLEPFIKDLDPFPSKTIFQLIIKKIHKLNENRSLFDQIKRFLNISKKIDYLQIDRTYGLNYLFEQLKNNKKEIYRLLNIDQGKIIISKLISHLLIISSNHLILKIRLIASKCLGEMGLINKTFLNTFSVITITNNFNFYNQKKKILKSKNLFNFYQILILQNLNNYLIDTKFDLVLFANYCLKKIFYQNENNFNKIFSKLDISKQLELKSYKSKTSLLSNNNFNLKLPKKLIEKLEKKKKKLIIDHININNNNNNQLWIIHNDSYKKWIKRLVCSLINYYKSNLNNIFYNCLNICLINYQFCELIFPFLILEIWYFEKSNNFYNSISKNISKYILRKKNHNLNSIQLIFNLIFIIKKHNNNIKFSKKKQKIGNNNNNNNNDLIKNNKIIGLSFYKLAKSFERIKEPFSSTYFIELIHNNNNNNNNNENKNENKNKLKKILIKNFVQINEPDLINGIVGKENDLLNKKKFNSIILKNEKEKNWLNTLTNYDNLLTTNGIGNGNHKKNRKRLFAEKNENERINNHNNNNNNNYKMRKNNTKMGKTINNQNENLFNINDYSQENIEKIQLNLKENNSTLINDNQLFINANENNLNYDQNIIFAKKFNQEIYFKKTLQMLENLQYSNILENYLRGLIENYPNLNLKKIINFQIRKHWSECDWKLKPIYKEIIDSMKKKSTFDIYIFKLLKSIEKQNLNNVKKYLQEGRNNLITKMKKSNLFSVINQLYFFNEIEQNCLNYSRNGIINNVNDNDNTMKSNNGRKKWKDQIKENILLSDNNYKILKPIFTLQNSILQITQRKNFQIDNLFNLIKLSKKNKKINQTKKTIYYLENLLKEENKFLKNQLRKTNHEGGGGGGGGDDDDDDSNEELIKNIKNKLCYLSFQKIKLISKEGNNRLAINRAKLLEGTVRDPLLLSKINIKIGKWSYKTNSIENSLILNKHLNKSIKLVSNYKNNNNNQYNDDSDDSDDDDSDNDSKYKKKREREKLKFKEEEENYLKQQLKAFHSLAKTSDSIYQNIEKRKQSFEWKEMIKNQINKKNELKARIKLYKKKINELSNEKKTFLEKTINNLKKMCLFDEQIIKNVNFEQQKVLSLAIENYGKCLIYSNNQKFDLIIFRFISLWFQNLNNNEINHKMKKILPKINSKKFLPLFHQIASRISTLNINNKNYNFQLPLNHLIRRIIKDNPQQTLFQIFSLKNNSLINQQKLLSKNNNNNVNKNKNKNVDKELKQIWLTDNQRIEAITDLLSTLSYDRKYKEIINQMTLLINSYIQFSNYDLPEKNKKEDLPPYKIPKKYQINKLNNLNKINIPTKKIDNNNHFSNENNNQLITINNFNKFFNIDQNDKISKILVCNGSDGKKYKQVLKINHDLKQDVVIQQLFTLVNTILTGNKETKKRKLKIRTYQVVPLTPNIGVIELISNSMAFGDWLVGNKNSKDSIRNSAHCRYRPNDWLNDKCKNEMRKIQNNDNVNDNFDLNDEDEDEDDYDMNFNSNNNKLNVYQKILKNFKPVFRHFFFEKFLDYNDWFEKKLNYTRSVAVNSIIGYILGIGGRHLRNLLIDLDTAEQINVNFNLIFDQAKLLPIPEIVPFRLTPDVIDGFGITKIEGTFRRSCEKTISVLRNNHDNLLMILDVFLHDPLTKWSISNIKALQIQNSQEEEENDDDDDNKIDIEQLNIFDEQSQKFNFKNNNNNNDDDDDGDYQIEKKERKFENYLHLNQKQNNKEAKRALAQVKQKLKGYDNQDQLSVEGQVNMLINESMDSKNLAKMYRGWCSWV